MTWRFDWSVVITPELKRRVTRAARVSGTLPAAHVALLKRTLAASGGLPLTTEALDARARTALGARVLQDAVTATLRRIRGEPAEAGVRSTARTTGPLEYVQRAAPRVGLNSATASQIAQHTGITRADADALVAERVAHGAYRNVHDLRRRTAAAVLKRVATPLAMSAAFDLPSDALRRSRLVQGDLDSDLATLVSLQLGPTARDRLGQALSTMAESVGRQPHPATRSGLRRTDGPPRPRTSTTVTWVGILAGSDYYKHLVPLFDAATRSIDVCMFHMAAPGRSHPTQKLLDALRNAQARGVSVRVLLDRDRPTDVYKSTIINEVARTRLIEGGVAVRGDAEERLLHSKFVCIDRTLSVVGSHNWSAGSYFQFDDLSFALSGAGFARQLRARFERLWAAGVEED